MITRETNARRTGRPARSTSDLTLAGRVGQVMRARRLELGLTLAQASARTGGRLSGVVLGNYEAGTEAGLEKFLWACLALGACPMDLLPSDVRLALARGASAGDLEAAMGKRRTRGEG